MALDGIGSLNIDIADREAQGIVNKQNRNPLRGIGAVASKGLSSYEEVVKLEADTQQKRQRKELLAKGVEGVMAYAVELGLDPAIYQRIGQHSKTEEQLIGNYQMVKKDFNDSERKKKIVAQELKNRTVVGEAESLVTRMAAGELTPKETQNSLNILIGDPDLDSKTRRDVNMMNDNVKSERTSRALSKGKKTGKNGRLLPSRSSDEKSVKATMKQMSFGDRGGQKVLGTAILKQIAIQDGLDTIEGINQGDIKGSNVIGREIASIIASVLAGAGQASQASVENMFPASWEGTVKEAWGRATGKPQDSMPEDMLNQLEDMLKREGTFWNQRISEMNAELSIGLAPIFDRVAWDTGKPQRLNEDLRTNFLQFLGMIEERGSIGERLMGASSERNRVKDSKAHIGIIETIRGDDASRASRGEAPRRQSTKRAPRVAQPTATQSVEPVAGGQSIETGGDISDDEFSAGINSLFGGQ